MQMNMEVLNKARINKGMWRSPENAQYGAFQLDFRSYTFLIIADDGETTGWEHVSVSLKNRCPNWEEMSYIKSLFWGEEEAVIQYHPPKSQYVNNHPNCLHMWKPKDKEIPLPPTYLVGIK